jgi:hypothetical protein
MYFHEQAFVYIRDPEIIRNSAAAQVTLNGTETIKPTLTTTYHQFISSTSAKCSSSSSVAVKSYQVGCPTVQESEWYPLW